MAHVEVFLCSYHHKLLFLLLDWRAAKTYNKFSEIQDMQSRIQICRLDRFHHLPGDLDLSVCEKILVYVKQVTDV